MSPVPSPPQPPTLAVLAGTETGEMRVALTPEMVKKYKEAGMAAKIETGAGEKAGFPDAAYLAAGAQTGSRADLLQTADMILCAAPLTPEEAGKMKRGAVLAGLLSPHRAEPLVKAAEKAGLVLFALERLPRISRAQPMDVLSSQSNLAGYRAVIEGQHLLKRIMPMMMTAAGTIAAAKVLVLGAGVAGLQAIATAKRLGARVSASDVRREVREQVESLGAKFLMVEDAGDESGGQGGGGYAKTMSADYQRKQQAMLADALKEQDLAICTALVPGKPAPELISAKMARAMKPGAVIMDMAAAEGGNCALSRPGEIVREKGVIIAAPLDLASQAASDASALLARNLFAFITYLAQAGGAEGFAREDEILSAVLLCRPKTATGKRKTKGDPS